MHQRYLSLTFLDLDVLTTERSNLYKGGCKTLFMSENTHRSGDRA